jgi:hypothetical protein
MNAGTRVAADSSSVALSVEDRLLLSQIGAALGIGAATITLLTNASTGDGAAVAWIRSRGMWSADAVGGSFPTTHATETPRLILQWRFSSATPWLDFYELTVAGAVPIELPPGDLRVSIVGTGGSQIDSRVQPLGSVV